MSCMGLFYIMQRIDFETGGFKFSIQCHATDAEIRDDRGLYQFKEDDYPAQELDGIYSIVDESDMEWPDCDENDLLWDSEIWRMGVTDDDRYFVDVHYPYHPGQLQRLALINKDFSRAKVVKRKMLDGRKSLDHFDYPIGNIILFSRLAMLGAGVIHGCAIEAHGKAYLFSGPSGAGKSTIAKIWKACGYTLLNDERNIVFIRDGIPMLSSTPWHGELPEINKGTLPLAGVFFLEQHPCNDIIPVSPVSASMKLMANSMAPHHHAENMNRLLEVYDQIFERCPAFHLKFKPDTECVQLCLDAAQKHAKA